MDNAEPSKIGEVKQERPFKSRWGISIRLISFCLVFSFFYEQVLWAAGEQDLLQKNKRKDLAQQMGFLPSYLQKRNQEALKNVRDKEDLNNLSKLLEDQISHGLLKISQIAHQQPPHANHNVAIAVKERQNLF